ncbi:MAG: tetratricopeptide repeat protein, partial [Victivallales bacterium]|nr:tetratricopeptide repeat protein [Victivallales bacterium]
MQRYDEAIEYSLKAIELDPDYVICHDNLGLAYAYKEEYDKATASFKKAIELDAGYADAHFNLGSLYYKLDDNESAVKSYEQFIGLSSKQKKIEEAKAIIEEIENAEE